MLKKASVLFLAVIITVNVMSQNVFAIGIPNLADIASDAASSISEAAGDAKDTMTGAVGKAGEVISGAASQAGETISGAASQAGDMASGTVGKIGEAASAVAGQAGELASGFTSQAGKVAAEWGKHAGETADNVKKVLADAGVKVQVSASDLGNATASKAAELTDKAGNVANDAIDAVSDARNMVVDQAGHVVDLAAAGAGYVSSAAGTAYQVLLEKGATLMQIAEDAVSDIDLSDENSWVTARVAVDGAIEKAYAEGILSNDKVDKEVVRIVTSVVFGTMMYGYQYSNEQITLGQYVASMSEVLIREGLPTGVGLVVGRLMPYAGTLARDATLYLISVAYADKSGEEIEKEEDMIMEDVEDVLPEK